MTVQLATFTVADHLFGVPVHMVQEVLRSQEITRVPLSPEAIGGLINLRGQVVTAIDVRTRLAYPAADPGFRPMTMVVRSRGDIVSLLVDRIGDVVDAEESRFEAPPETLTGPGRDLIIGAYKLENTLLLALDVDPTVDVPDAA
jgi:purine-binding chemotaxis protein CheW